MRVTNVIDFHVHVGSFERLRGDIQALLRQLKGKQDFDLEVLFSSPTGLYHYLQSEGVVNAVILAEEGPGTNFHITTEFVCDFRDEANTISNDFFVAFGNINPHRTPDISAAYRRDKARGIKGYKLYPADHNYHPISDSLMCFYKELERDGMILMFHTGTTSQEGGADQYGNPLLFRPILDECPRLTVVFAHAGKPTFCREAAFCARQYQNCYLDTAFISPSKLLTYLPDIENYAEKVLFGSDWPAGVASLSGHIAALTELGLRPQTLRRVFFENAAQLLGIAEKRAAAT